MKYRAEIDGLRGLAVLGVVLFHTGVPELSGGFVGVDIFFVISGYLITKILAAEMDAGTFSVRRFYERRIRRIFPALFCVSMVSAIAAALLLLPADLINFGKSLASAALFVSNVFFWRQAGYFDEPSALKPLLHTWSLSVEEQFYIFFPLALALLSRFGQRATRVWLGLFCAISLALSVWAVRNAPSAAFYLGPMRAWELLLGAIVASGAFPALKTAFCKNFFQRPAWA